MFRRIVVFLASLLFLLNSALVNATTINGWFLSNPTAVRASILYDGTKGSATSSILISPNASQVAKVLRGGIAGYTLTFAVEQLLGAVDWVMDPANNRIKYFETSCPANNCVGWYFGNTFLTSVKNPESACSAFWLLRTDLHANFLNGGPYIYTDISIRCMWNDKYNRLEGSNLVNYITIGKVEKTLSLETVAQQVIENAQNNDLDSQFAVLAAATNILSEAEQDDAKAKPIEDELERNADPKCSTHYAYMNGAAAVVEQRYNEMFKDYYKLFINHKYNSNPHPIPGVGSWEGHLWWYKNVAQKNVSSTIFDAKLAGCQPTSNAIRWEKKAPPPEPGVHSLG